MSECEIVRGLRDELEEAKRLLDREIKANNYTETEARSLIESYRRERDEAIRERDSLREEIARRDAEKPGTALSWIEKTDKRIDALTTSVSSRLDGPTGVEKRIVETDKRISDIMDLIDLMNRTNFDRLAKLEARVSKKRVKK
jgi:hypothetical protein